MGDALVESLTVGKSWDRVAMAFGGTHYPAKINDLLLNSDMATTTVVAKHSLDGVDSAMFGQIIQRTTRFPRFVTIDWKGMGKNKDRILGLAKQFSLEVVKL